MTRGKGDCLWRRITAELAEKLESGKFAKGGPFLTLNQISEAYEVSKITSRRVLDELERKGFIEKGRGRVPCVSRSSKGGELFVLDAGGDERPESISFSPIFAKLYEGVLEECARQGCEAKPVSCQYFRSLKDPSGLRVVVLQDLPKDPDLNALFLSGAFSVACAHSLSPWEGVATVRANFRRGAFLAVSHLASKGHSRIGFLKNSGGSAWFNSRFEGYYEALKKAKIPFDMDLVADCELKSEEDVSRALDRLLRLPKPPSALFCPNDVSALSILRICAKRGIDVPSRLAVIGFDNSMEAQLSSPPLSSVETSFKLQGAEAARLALSMTPGESKDLLIEPELALRASS